jgi:hypothetical protein
LAGQLPDDITPSARNNWHTATINVAPGTGSWFVIAAFAVVLSCSAIYADVYRKYIIDDAYITFAYSQNLAQHGFLYLRQNETVEANSSFLWAALLGLLSCASFSPPTWAKVIGSLSHALTLFLLLLIFRDRSTRFALLLIAACGAASANFGLWANYGMEQGFFGLLVWTGVLLMVSGRRTSLAIAMPISLLLVSMVRPEGFLYAGALLAAAYLRLGVVRTHRHTFPQLACGTVLFLAGFATFKIFEHAYYGTWLPNSASAKVNQSSLHLMYKGTGYVLRSLPLGGWIIVLCSAICALQFVKGGKEFGIAMLREWPGAAFGLAVLATQMTFTVISGGDWMPNGRFLAIATPFAAMYCCWWFVTVSRSFSRWNIIVPSVFVLIWIASQAVATAITVQRVDHIDIANQRAVLAIVTDLNRVALSSDTLALSDIGQASYYFKGNIFDWWGLASRKVTERGESIGRISPKTLFETMPEFIVLYSNEPRIHEDSRFEGMAQFTKQVALETSWQRDYCFVASYLFEKGRYHVLIARKDIFLRIASSDSDIKRKMPLNCEPPVSP